MAVIIPSKLPEFNYSGTYSTELRADWGWVIRFTSSGTLTFAKGQKIDAYLLGGGGGGGGGSDEGHGGGGGGGYHMTQKRIGVAADTPYTITVGSGGAGGSINTVDGESGGASSAFGYSVNGGGYGRAAGWNYNNGQGGAGGTGNGGGAGYQPGSNTVREFMETSTSWPLYGGGGSGGGDQGVGGSPYGGNIHGAAKGPGGGGGGGFRGTTDAVPTGGSNGYQGIVCIRNSEILELPVKFDGTTLTGMFFNGSEVKSLVFNGATLFMEHIRGWLKRFGIRTRSVQPAV